MKNDRAKITSAKIESGRELLTNAIRDLNYFLEFSENATQQERHAGHEAWVAIGCWLHKRYSVGF